MFFRNWRWPISPCWTLGILLAAFVAPLLIFAILYFFWFSASALSDFFGVG